MHCARLAKPIGASPEGPSSGWAYKSEPLGVCIGARHYKKRHTPQDTAKCLGEWTKSPVLLIVLVR